MAKNQSTEPTARSRQEVLSDLLHKTALRDLDAFSLLYSMTSGPLYGMMLGMTNYAAACEDLLQEVYLTVWRKADQYRDDKAAVSTWLSTIARNRTLDWLRSNSSRQTRETAHQSLEALDLASGVVDRDDKGSDILLNSTLQACIENLSEEQREAILLAYFEGHTHSELAKRLNSALGTVKSWVRRGLASLKTCLQAAGGTP